MVLASLFESLPLTCPAAPVQQILAHIGETAEPTAIAPACGPPAWDEEPVQMPNGAVIARPEPESMLV